MASGQGFENEDWSQAQEEWAQAQEAVKKKKFVPTKEQLAGLFRFAQEAQDILQDEEGLGEILNSSYVAESPIHGLGLFANRDMEKDTIVAFYPVHAVGNQETVFTTGREYWESSTYRTDMLHENVAGDAWIDTDSERADVPGWTAHRANDAAMLKDSSVTAIIEYVNTSSQKSNCILAPFGDAVPIIAMFTRRPVVKDEELTLSYSPGFWLDDMALSSDKTLSSELNTAIRKVYTDNDYYFGTRLRDMLFEYLVQTSTLSTLLKQKYGWPPDEPEESTIDVNGITVERPEDKEPQLNRKARRAKAKSKAKEKKKK